MENQKDIRIESVYNYEHGCRHFEYFIHLLVKMATFMAK